MQRRRLDLRERDRDDRDDEHRVELWGEHRGVGVDVCERDDLDLVDVHERVDVNIVDVRSDVADGGERWLDLDDG